MFEWPQGDVEQEMSKKDMNIFNENECTYICGKQCGKYNRSTINKCNATCQNQALLTKKKDLSYYIYYQTRVFFSFI